MLHYSFPPFSINEVGKRVGLNRREVGHGKPNFTFILLCRMSAIMKHAKACLFQVDVRRLTIIFSQLELIKIWQFNLKICQTLYNYGGALVFLHVFSIFQCFGSFIEQANPYHIQLNLCAYLRL